MGTTPDTNTQSGRLVRQNGVLYRECNGRYEDSHPTGNPAIPYFQQWVVDMVPVDGAEIQRPKCEHKGSAPHPATHVLVWNLSFGRQTKFMCEKHSKDVGSQPYWVSKLIGVNY